MRLIDLKDLTPEQLKSFAEFAELTAEEKAEISRLFVAQFAESDLRACENWDEATSFEDFLHELKKEQRQWDEQPR